MSDVHIRLSPQGYAALTEYARQRGVKRTQAASELLTDRVLGLIRSAPAAPVPERVASVYVVKVGPLYKIGMSVDPEKRIRTMQLPEKPDVVRIYEAQRARELECVLHQRFHAHREYGEWFLLNDDSLAEIDRCVETWRQTARYAGEGLNGKGRE